MAPTIALPGWRCSSSWCWWRCSRLGDRGGGASLSWSGPAPLDRTGGREQLQGVACPSASQCTAVDDAGQLVIFNPEAPGTPTPTTIDAGHALTGVACPSASQFGWRSLRRTRVVLVAR